MKVYKIRIIIYIAAFIVTAAFTYLFKVNNIINNSENYSMGGATIPVVYMVSEGGTKYNYLYGYKSEMDYSQMHDVITPVGTDRNFSFFIDTYGSEILQVAYDVRDLSGKTLIERNKVNNFSEKNGQVNVNVKLKNLLTIKKEYIVRIAIETKKNGTVSYYTRIMLTDDANIDGKLSYVKWFCACTMSEDTLNQIIPKLEPDKTGDNTNLGHVNIHSKLSQVGFGKLRPSVSGEIYPEINEIATEGKVASLTLKYRMTTSDNRKVYNYDVTEFYRINQVNENTTYVYAFDRFIDQKFSPEYGVSDSFDIYLGITPDDDIQYRTNAAGTVIAFVKNGNLWSYHPNRDKFNKVFSFEAEEKEVLREHNQNHRIKIINVDDKGNIFYLVYGYMNRGLHEGYTGIAAYKYSFDKNTSEELVFIPNGERTEVTEESIEKLAYINDQSVLYFYQNRSIYYLNYETKECMLLDSNVIADTCMMSDNYVLVYQTGDDVNRCSSIKIVDLKNGSMKNIQAGKGEYIKNLNFIDNNIVYGTANENNVSDTKFYMKSLKIVDDELKPIREYSVKNVFIVDAEFYNSKIVIKRMAYNENHELVAIADDQLLSNDDSTGNKAEIKIISSEERQKEVYIRPEIKGEAGTNSQKAKFVFNSDTMVYINNEFDVEINYYYVYVYGRLYYVSENFDSCKELAKNTGGVVIDSTGTKLYDRYMEKK